MEVECVIPRSERYVEPHEWIDRPVVVGTQRVGKIVDARADDDGNVYVRMRITDPKTKEAMRGHL